MSIQDYKNHNYIKEEIIKEKIRENKVTSDDMKDPLY